MLTVLILPLWKAEALSLTEIGIHCMLDSVRDGIPLTEHQLTDCVLSLEESISTLCLFKLVKMKAKKVMRMCRWSWQVFKQHIWTELQDQDSESFDFFASFSVNLSTNLCFK